MHQPVDHGGSQGVIDVEDMAPVLEGAIRRQDDRASFIAGCHDLKHQICTAFIDRKISQLIEEEKLRTNILSEFLLQSSIKLCCGQHVDHVDGSREPDTDSLFTGHVTKCREYMCLSNSGWADQHRAAERVIELAVEQPEHFLLGDTFGEVEVVFSQRFNFPVDAHRAHDEL